MDGIRAFGTVILKVPTQNGDILNHAVLKEKLRACLSRKNVKLSKNNRNGLTIRRFYAAKIAKELDQINTRERNINALVTAQITPDTADHVKSGNAAGRTEKSNGIRKNHALSGK